MRERNRIAQRRYRNRQRFRLQEAEQKLVELTERVRVLTSEKVSHKEATAASVVCGKILDIGTSIIPGSRPRAQSAIRFAGPCKTRHGSVDSPPGLS